ncbi:MAG: hypothetical protein WBD51_03260, partial [Burkholderiaceae bacterium]
MDDLLNPQPAATTEQQITLAGLGRALVQHRVMRPDQAMSVQKAANDAKVSFIDELISSKQMTAPALAKFV